MLARVMVARESTRCITNQLLLVLRWGHARPSQRLALRQHWEPQHCVEQGGVANVRQRCLYAWMYLAWVSATSSMHVSRV